MRTRGDRDASASLDQIGGQGVFVTEVEAAVADGRADAAVHSAKDMPSTMPDRPRPRRGAPDGPTPATAWSGARWPTLPPGGLVATGSARRRAQLAYLRPDLVFTDLRGNMARRVAVGEDGSVSAVVVAVAAMERLGWDGRLSDVLDPMDLLPQAGQGAIAVQCRADDDGTRRLLAAIDHEPSHRAVRAERAVLAALGGSCTVPVGAFAERMPGPDERAQAAATLRVSGLVASGDGRTVIRMARRGDDPEAVGRGGGACAARGGGAAIDGFDGGAAPARDAAP